MILTKEQMMSELVLKIKQALSLFSYRREGRRRKGRGKMYECKT